jgi:hypothetical protein
MKGLLKMFRESFLDRVGLRICTREPVRLTDVVETSYPGTQGWYGLQRIFPLEFFLGGLTGIADRFGLRRTTDESK